MLVWIVRIVAVVGLLGAAAAVATPKGRLPLALRGIRRMLRKDAGLAGNGPVESVPVPAWRKLVAFLLVLAAAVVAAGVR